MQLHAQLEECIRNDPVCCVCAEFSCDIQMGRLKAESLPGVEAAVFCAVESSQHPK